MAAEAVGMKTLAGTLIVGVTDNNQPKLAAEEMAVETAMATVTTTTTERSKTAATMAVVSMAFLHHRQHSTKRSSRMNGCNDIDGDGDSNNNNGRG